MTAVEVRCAGCGQANALAEAAPPQEERKLVSVLFVDGVDSTARADKADPEDVREVLHHFPRSGRRTPDWGSATRR